MTTPTAPTPLLHVLLKLQLQSSRVDIRPLLIDHARSRLTLQSDSWWKPRVLRSCLHRVIADIVAIVVLPAPPVRWKPPAPRRYLPDFVVAAVIVVVECTLNVGGDVDELWRPLGGPVNVDKTRCSVPRRCCHHRPCCWSLEVSDTQPSLSSP